VKSVVAMLLAASAALPLAQAGASAGFRDSTSSTATFTAASSFGTPCPPQVTLIANRDATIDEKAPSTNFGSATTLLVRSSSGGDARALLGFDLPASGGCDVLFAQLRVFQESGTALRPLAAHQVSSTWTESFVTWNNRPAEFAFPATAFAPGAGKWLTFDVAAQVRSMYSAGNNSLLLRDTSEHAASAQVETFTSANSITSSQRPQLFLFFG
jgi:hypothetical protein